MAKRKFGIAISEEIVNEINKVTEQCDDLNATRSEIIEAVLTAYFQSDVDHVARVRELIIRRRKENL